MKKPRKKKYVPVYWIDASKYRPCIELESIVFCQWKGFRYTDSHISEYVKEFTFEMVGDGEYYFPLVF